MLRVCGTFPFGIEHNWRASLRRRCPFDALPSDAYDVVKERFAMIRKLKSGAYRLYSRKKNPKTGKRRNLGTFSSLEKARQHERAVQYFKRH